MTTTKKAEHTGGANRAEQPKTVFEKYYRSPQRINACVAACNDMANPADAIEGLKKQLKFAHEELRFNSPGKAFPAIEAALRACGVKL